MPFKDPARAKAYYAHYNQIHPERQNRKGAVGKIANILADILDLPGHNIRKDGRRIPNKIINAIKQAMTEALQRGERVKIPGFGLFWIETCPPRKRVQASSGGGRQAPADHFIADLPERKRVMFRPYLPLVRFINENPS